LEAVNAPRERRDKNMSAFNAPRGNITRFVRHIDDLINASSKSQRQIAYEIGYDKPNLITMFKQGSTRVPAEKVPALAESLEVDPINLLRMWMEDYSPELLTVIEANMGMLLSRTEKIWVNNLRQRFPDGLPSWDELVEDALKPLEPQAKTSSE
jgi:hypothetical protein